MSDADHYHYTESGHDHIYLANGVELVDTPWGGGVHIAHADELHAEIDRLVARDAGTMPRRPVILQYAAGLGWVTVLRTARASINERE